MSPAEAAKILEEPDWLELWDAFKHADDGFEVILTKWRRWHWAPVVVDGVEKKRPASAVEAMIALADLGIWAQRNHDSEGYQYDDHCFLMSEGREWRIVGIEDRTMILTSDGEQWLIDLSRAKWDKYTEAAVAALEAKRSPRDHA